MIRAKADQSVATLAITVHLNPELHAALVRAAAHMGLSVTGYAARLLEIAAQEHQEIENLIAEPGDAPE